VSQEVVGQALELGLNTFGENRVQEALPKVAAFPGAQWHFIGRLQTNKAKEVVGHFALVHSVDRWRLVQALQKQAQEQETVVRALIQVNVGGEGQKGGISPTELQDFLAETVQCKNLQIEGLMTIPPFTENPEDARPYFREMNRLFVECSNKGFPMKYLSMGMSNDYTVAVEEGANLVRVGSAIFGERN
ncbi:YggS family pyridoxal phosphate-dependent enzyme, partial [Dethiobacter alkaliphilus]